MKHGVWNIPTYIEVISIMEMSEIQINSGTYRIMRASNVLHKARIVSGLDEIPFSLHQYREMYSTHVQDRCTNSKVVLRT